MQIVFYNYIVYTIHREIHKMGVETTSKGNTGGIIMDTIRLKARAKINLELDVARRREDGYHEVRMVMQMLSQYLLKQPKDQMFRYEHHHILQNIHRMECSQQTWQSYHKIRGIMDFL